jgi:3'(2'), 5'-bisphosphate nucleotidase
MPHPAKIGSASLLDALTAVVGQASAAILALAPDALNLRRKADNSPVTAADEAAEALILEGLTRLLPGVPVVSEEATIRPTDVGGTFMLVDPLDGTREFINGRPEFTVNIALIEDGAPLLGVVAAPALRRLWRGRIGQGAERLSLSVDACAPNAPEAISTRRAPSELVAMTSRSHLDARTEALLARLPVRERQAIGSSVKFGYVAEGSADIYARLAPTSEWDIAAGHAVLVAAGGSVTTPDGQPIRYGGVASDFKVPAFIAWGDCDAAQLLRA